MGQKPEFFQRQSLKGDRFLFFESNFKILIFAGGLNSLKTRSGMTKEEAYMLLGIEADTSAEAIKKKYGELYNDFQLR